MEILDLKHEFYFPWGGGMKENANLSKITEKALSAYTCFVKQSYVAQDERQKFYNNSATIVYNRWFVPRMLQYQDLLEADEDIFNKSKNHTCSKMDHEFIFLTRLYILWKATIFYYNFHQVSSFQVFAGCNGNFDKS